MDLLLPPAFKNDPPKLEIKKDQKGMVTVAGSTNVEVSSLEYAFFLYPVHVCPCAHLI